MPNYYLYKVTAVTSKPNRMSCKALVQRYLQKVLGFKTYLFLFSYYRIKTIKNYEPGFNVFITMIPGNGVILDIGANIGITVVPLAQKHSNSKVYAFEPIQTNYNTLTRIITFFDLKNVTTVLAAVGSSTGTVNMVMPIVDGVKKQGLSKLDDNNTDGRVEKVNIHPLDAYSFKEPVTAIKIDVEGHELEVLKGATQLLREDKPIIYCELWDSIKAEAIAYLKSFNYRAFVYEEETSSLVPYIQQSSDNFFFIVK